MWRVDPKLNEGTQSTTENTLGGLRAADLFVSMDSQQARPQLQAVDGLPAVDVPERVSSFTDQCPAQQYRQLLDVREGVAVRCRRV